MEKMTEIRKMQLEIVYMMSDINALFNKNSIKYTLLGGSVLGAIRHNGFIPWDDDMDVGVFRVDFEKVEKLLSSMKKYVYEPAETHSVPDAPIGHIHVVNNTYKIENSPTIDVFALDYVPDDKKNQKKLRFYANIHHLAVLRRAPKNRGKIKRILFQFLLNTISEKSWDKIQRLSLKKIMEFCKNQNTWIGNIWGFWTEKEYFPREVYENLVVHDFEGMQLPIPADYNKYLSQMYGNYMELPPEEKRVPKHREF